MKTKIIMSGLLIFAIVQTINGQNASYNANGATPSIGGTNNSGFGWFALNNTTSGTENSATGYEALNQLTTGDMNTANGRGALFSNYKGSRNTASGFRALYNTACSSCGAADNNTGTGLNALYTNQTGKENTAVGTEAMYNNTSGNYNTAHGYRSLYSNDTGNQNTALGAFSLYMNTSGDYNTAIGQDVLHDNTQGIGNTAVGYQVLYKNDNVGGLYGSYNTAVGRRCLYNSVCGRYNAVSGNEAMYLNTVGSNNTAAGYQSLFNNINGIYNVGIGSMAGYSSQSNIGNVAIGYQALYSNTGDKNTCVGTYAGYGQGAKNYNTAIGYQAMYSASGNYNTLFGAFADVSGVYDNQTIIGPSAVGTNASDQITLGNPYGVGVTETQSAFSIISDGRFKYNVAENVKGLEFINRLRPVAYNLDSKAYTEFITKNLSDSLRKKHLSADFKNSALRQTGFIAQEVEKTAKEINYDFDGVHHPNNDNDTYGIAYSMFVVPLVKAVQEQQVMIEAQTSRTERLKNELEEQMQKVIQFSNRSAITTEIQLINGASKKSFEMMAQPNPFSFETLITYSIPANVANPTLIICDLSGTQILSYVLTEKETGSVTVKSDKLNPGMYIYSIIDGGTILGSKRLIVSGR